MGNDWDKADAGKPIAPSSILHSLSKDLEKILRSYDEDMDLKDGDRFGLSLNQLLANVDIVAKRAVPWKGRELYTNRETL